MQKHLTLTPVRVGCRLSTPDLCQLVEGPAFQRDILMFSDQGHCPQGGR